jgi:hypothetical protein
MTVTGDKDAAARLPEVQFLLDCARIEMSADSLARSRALLKKAKAFDWDYLFKIALRHKVLPLIYRQLKANFDEIVPAPLMLRLQDFFYLNAARNQLLTAELCEILEAFETGRVRVVPYKGPMLAARVYGDTALRQFSDLDIFVRQDEVTTASRLLYSRGYRKEHELTAAREKAFLKIECEHLFTCAEKQIYLDLHWGFVPKYFPIRLDSEAIWRRLEPVAIGDDTPTHTFAAEDLLLILCVNAGKEFWKELSRLCDINELIRAHPYLDWAGLARRAKLAGAYRMLLISLCLVHELLGATLPAEIIDSITAESAVRHLASIIERGLFREEGEGEGVAQILKPARALDGLPAQVKFHLRSALTPTPEDWTFVNLPERLRFLYYLTRPLRLTRKYLLRRGNEA